jgi:hypothetical protein
MDREVEVEGEEEIKLQLVELAQRQAADVRPSRIGISLVLEVLGGGHGGYEKEALEGARGEYEVGAANLELLDIEESSDVTAKLALLFSTIRRR